ncbi:BURP domain-containing protein 3-like protein [Carex littledalei]|uniref:BURP domain-containing protein 3-like protein n=1 Tax=Carex littledalei TaxID=544730 RepID=A0A833VSM3_9POAL|nr:BURP domain-containing protein 3-like protein [Carex littledalei]
MLATCREQINTLNIEYISHFSFLDQTGLKEKFIWEDYKVVWNIRKVSMDVLSIFFQPKHIYPGAKIKEAIRFDRSVVGNAFIPRVKAEAIPFSSKNLSQFLNHYSINPSSKEAKQIKRGLSDCESPVPKGTKQFCATSLESMIDNVISELGTQNLQVISTIQLVKRGAKEKIFYKVGSPVKELPQEKFVLCHPVASPQAVFYCHTAPKFKGYVIPLEGNNGTKVNALAICHYDTKDFSPVFFEMLNVNLTTKLVICHFLMKDYLAWTPHS